MKMVLFGAGKIGRSFVGQLFARAGYEVVFVDLFAPVIRQLNARGAYDVVIKSPDGDETIRVEGVRGVMADNIEEVAQEVASCDIAAVSVGQKGLSHIIPPVAKGLQIRFGRDGLRPLDIILAENMRDAAGYVSGLLKDHLPEGFPAAQMTGLIETSIGKMVPIMPPGIQDRDPLLVYAESYNTLILDARAFKNPIPDVPELAPRENIKAWVDRKSYIHNFGHVAAAYRGYAKFPEAAYLWEVLADKDIYDHTRAAMLQSAGVLMAKYPGEFTLLQLTEHIDDLLNRFANRALGDTVFRVGCDLRRKLWRTDRVLGPLLDAIAYGLPADMIAEVFVDGSRFRACSPDGQMLPDDASLVCELQEKGLLYVLENICGLDPKVDGRAIDLICRAFEHANMPQKG